MYVSLTVSDPHPYDDKLTLLSIEKAKRLTAGASAFALLISYGRCGPSNAPDGCPIMS